MTAENPLQSIVAALAFDNADRLLARLRTLREMILKANQHVNLISRRDSETVLLSLIADSLTLLRLVDYHPNATLLDLGSGAGFPWLPQKMARPDLKIISVDSNRRKLEFQRSVVRELQLQDCRLEPFRLEELPPQEIDFLIAKGVADIAELAQIATPHLHSGGLLVLPRGPHEPDPDYSDYGEEFEIVLVQEYAPPAPAPEAKLLLLRKI